MDHEEKGAEDYGPPPQELIEKISGIVDGQGVGRVVWALANVMGSAIASTPPPQRPALMRAAIEAICMALDTIQAMQEWEEDQTVH